MRSRFTQSSCYKPVALELYLTCRCVLQSRQIPFKICDSILKIAENVEILGSYSYVGINDLKPLGGEGSHFSVGQGPTYSLEFQLLRPHLLSPVCYWPGSGICVCDSCFRKVVGKGEKEIGELRYLIPEKDDFQGKEKDNHCLICCCFKRKRNK